MEYRVVLDNSRQAFSSYMGKWDVNGIPHAFIVNKGGSMVWHGHPAEPEMEDKIREAIDEVIVNLGSMGDEAFMAMSIKELKTLMTKNGISFKGLLEKSEFVAMIRSKFPKL